MYIAIGLFVAAATMISLLEPFWGDIVNFVNRAINKIKDLARKFLQGVKIFVRKVKEAVEEVSKYYSKIGVEWEETTVTRKISASEVPADILEKAEKNAGMVDITKKTEEALKLIA